MSNSFLWRYNILSLTSRSFFRQVLQFDSKHLLWHAKYLRKISLCSQNVFWKSRLLVELIQLDYTQVKINFEPHWTSFVVIETILFWFKAYDLAAVQAGKAKKAANGYEVWNSDLQVAYVDDAEAGRGMEALQEHCKILVQIQQVFLTFLYTVDIPWVTHFSHTLSDTFSLSDTHFKRKWKFSRFKPFFLVNYGRFPIYFFKTLLNSWIGFICT